MAIRKKKFTRKKAPSHSTTLGGDADPRPRERQDSDLTQREADLERRERRMAALEGKLEPKMHRYKLKRDCYWGDGMDARLWREQDAPEKDGVFVIDVNRMGTPPHHFEPLDGGPVLACRPGSIFDVQGPTAAPTSDPEPSTLHEHAFSPKPAEPVGLPKN